MKIKILCKILICFLAINLNAQEKTKENLDLETKQIEKLLIGEWKFVKTVDENNKKVEFIAKDYKLFDGSDINVVAKGPEIKLNSDHTYTLKFTEKNSDNGFWKLVGTNKILYKMTTLKDSEGGKMIDEAVIKLNVEWKTDKDGNYLDTSTDEIISINEKEMRIRYEKKYILIYQKK